MAVFDRLKTLNASGNRTPLVAVMITSDSLREPICLVQSYDEHRLKDAEGVTHTFIPCAMSVSLPERNTSGFSDINFTIGDTQGIALGYCRRVVESHGTAELVVLQYLPDETTPIYFLRLSVTNADITQKQAVFSAGWHDVLNRAWPKRRYTARKFKGLRYVS